MTKDMLKAHTKTWQKKRKQETCSLIGRTVCEREIETEEESVQGVYEATAVKIYSTIDKKGAV